MESNDDWLWEYQQEEMMAVLTGNQVMTIAVNFQNTQRIREAARVLEMLGSHLTQEQIVQLFDNIDYDRVQYPSVHTH